MVTIISAYPTILKSVKEYFISSVSIPLESLFIGHLRLIKTLLKTNQKKVLFFS